ncbi:MAG: Mur ligase family protein [Candidatus Shapirobacteria bacterium]|nr:Mur ligase family protein [Candidatus Shapirobacteria bacterium]
MKQKFGPFFLYYLRFFARLQLTKIKLIQNLKKKPLVIVGITGSTGKTSCLLACQAALTPQFKVKTNYGGNTESGIPLSILGLKNTDFTITDWIRVALFTPFSLLFNWRSYQIFLVEMGIDAPFTPKNMSYLLTIVHPDIGIFLNVSSVHLFNFKSIDDIAQEKAKLISTVKTAIINSADPLVKKYSVNKNLINISPVKVKFDNYALPAAFDTTFGAAFLLARILNLPRDLAETNLKTNFHPAPGRNSLFKGIKESQIIDSSYNSSPLATAEMLKLLSTFKSPRIAVLGDMRELGSSSESEHKKIYELALKCADQIITVGQNFKSQNNFKYWWKASEYLKENIKPNSTILVKGSQNTIFLEELVKELLANKDDISKLCRQSPYWLNVKKQLRSSYV